MVDFYEILLQDEHLRGMFENWGYDDKVLVSRCNDLLTKIKSYLYIFDYYPNILNSSPRPSLRA